ncbi:MAG: pyruvate kinase [Candidatus Doudnabacteria bacterium]
MLKKQTKIICTIGPASSRMETILTMLKEGMDVARVNFSHGTQEDNGALIRNVRGAARALGKGVAIIQDLQGPRVRVSNIKKGGLTLNEGEIAIITTAPLTPRQKKNQDKLKVFQVAYKKLDQDLKKGRIILIDDGLLKLKVLAISKREIKCRVLIGGLLTSGRGMNFPGSALGLSAITPKDRQDLEYGIKIGVDFVALSFVQSTEDVLALRRLIKVYENRETPRTKIIAKIEKEEALNNLEAIIEEADGIMIARGDLGIEIDPTRLPLIQKEIISKCLAAAKPVIVATHMLDSMQENPRPTRAEISDVANSVMDHVDAVMLSQETATGKYPTEAVKFMARTCVETERSPYDDIIYPSHPTKKELSPVLAMSQAACILVSNIRAKAILVTTRSGFSARALVSHRPNASSIIVVTGSPNVYRELLLSWGITPYLVQDFHDSQMLIQKSIKTLQKEELVKAGDRVVVMTGFKERGNGWSTSLRIVTV